jgi:hypothetical protein
MRTSEPVARSGRVGGTQISPIRPRSYFPNCEYPQGGLVNPLFGMTVGPKGVKTGRGAVLRVLPRAADRRLLSVWEVVPDSDDLAPAPAPAPRHRVRPKARRVAVAHHPAGLAHEFGNGPLPHAKGGGPSSFESVVQLRVRTRSLLGTGEGPAEGLAWPPWMSWVRLQVGDSGVSPLWVHSPKGKDAPRIRRAR